ncbi:MAG: PAS domain S-box protein [Verrucomicrobia bacterium]|nr:PAS domain S-box protein [Verrucomicrobiota bacterium]
MSEVLRIQQERFEQLSELNRTYVWEVDGEGRYTYVSNTVEAVLGYRPPDLVGKFFYDFHPPDLREDLKAKALDLFVRQACFRGFENPVVAKNGQILWFSTNGLPIVNDEGKCMAYRGMDIDITEKRNIERELILAQKNAEAAHYAKACFLANMGHEILTPLTTLLGFLALLKNTELTEEQASYAETAMDGADTLRILLEDLLDFAKIEAHKLELDCLDFDLHDLLESSSGQLAHFALEKGLELIYEVDPGLPSRLRGDPFRLGQIIRNLVTNAIQYTEEGEVIVKCKVVEETETEVTLRFDVEDTGMGIPGEQLPHLFDKFSHLENQTTGSQGGAGLGLALCKHLTTLMNGRMGVESEPGTGSLFWFTVRLTKQAKITRSNPIIPANLRNTRVLVVDDNPSLCELLVNRLSSWGMRATSANESSTALQQLEQALENKDPFALTLIDLEMPAMGGQALGQSIRADNRFDGMSLLLLVPLGTRRLLSGQLDRHFTGHIFKPIRNSELLTLVSKALPTL